MALGSEASVAVGDECSQFYTGRVVTDQPQAKDHGGTDDAANCAKGGVSDGGATLTQKEATLSEIVALYSDKSQYGSVSQLKHGCQAAQQAMDAGADDDTVVAALLHDIGWKLARLGETTIPYMICSNYTAIA